MQQNTFDRATIIKIIVAFIAITLLIIFLQWLYAFLTTGEVKITASSQDAEIYIFDKKTLEDKTLGTGKIASRLEPGPYSFTIKEGDGESRTTVNVERLKTVEKNVEIVQPGKIEEKISYLAKDIITQGNTILFVNIPFRAIYSFSDNDPQPVEYFQDKPVTQIKWSTFGKGYFRTSGRSTYKLNSPQDYSAFGVTQEETAANVGENEEEVDVLTIDAYDVNSSGSIIMLSNNEYFFQTGQETLAKKVNTPGVTSNSKPAIASDGKIAIFEESEIDIDEGREEGVTTSPEPKKPIKVYILDPIKNEAIADFEDNAGTSVEDFAWSPDSKKLAYATDDGVHIYSLDNRSNVTISTKSRMEKNSLKWISDARIAFVEAGALWTHDIGSSISTKNKVFSYREIGINSTYFDPITKLITIAGYPLNGVAVGKIYQTPIE